MNLWTQKSIELASQSDYLDRLYRVYPMSVNLRRELSDDTQAAIKQYLSEKDGINLFEDTAATGNFPD